jgi:hypothetical protein
MVMETVRQYSHEHDVQYREKNSFGSQSSVADLALYVLGPPGSGSVGTRYGLGKKIIISCHLEGHRLKWQDPEPGPELDPDPFVRGTDPRIHIRTKMSRIRNIVAKVTLRIRAERSQALSSH